jgi:hypothetical protein
MGGIGSGKRSSRSTVERFRARTISLSIRDLVARGVVYPGNVCRLEWQEDGCPSIGVRIEAGRAPNEERLMAVLEYRVGPAPEHLQAVEEVVTLAWSRCGFRGQSLRFRCPGCGRRVEKLYLKSHFFRCRRCCELNYRSQKKSRENRGLDKGARIRQRLGGNGDYYTEAFPNRPPRMHRKTYERLREQAEEAERPLEEKLQRALGAVGALLTKHQARQKASRESSSRRRPGLAANRGGRRRLGRPTRGVAPPASQGAWPVQQSLSSGAV